MRCLLLHPQHTPAPKDSAATATTTHLELKAVLHPRQLAQQREGDGAPHIHAAVSVVVGDPPAKEIESKAGRAVA